jgi:predicted phage-related endonuclease
MIKDLPPPTEAEEYRNVAEILRDLATQVRFANTRKELVSFAHNLDRLAASSERQIYGALDGLPLPATSQG